MCPRAVAVVGVATILLAACSATPRGDAGAPAPDATGEQGTCVPLSEFENGDVANAPEQERGFPWDREDPVVLEGFEFVEIISGGPPPDGIRPIDEPCFDSIAVADVWLEAQSPVMVVEIDGDQRAYPIAIMTQHEIVNDVVGGEPLVVTYCPLCNSGLAFERTVDGQVLDFGTSGRLFQSNLVMYDRQTKTLWTQFTGQAVVGEDHVGTELVRVATALLGWQEFKDAAPDGVVLSRDSVAGRDYGRNPYPGYEESPDEFLFRGPRDDQLPANTRVVGLGTGTDPVAIPLARLRKERVVELEVADEPLTVWWTPGQSSALDAATVDGGDDVGSTAAFVRRLDDGTELGFAASDEDEDRFVDDLTGSSWNLLGEAVDGELAGTRLEPVSRDDTFWFVWFAFQPETEVAGG